MWRPHECEKSSSSVTEADFAWSGGIPLICSIRLQLQTETNHFDGDFVKCWPGLPLLWLSVVRFRSLHLALTAMMFHLEHDALIYSCDWARSAVCVEPSRQPGFHTAVVVVHVDRGLWMRYMVRLDELPCSQHFERDEHFVGEDSSV